MPNVLTTASVINCPHLPGKLTFTVVNNKLKVLGSPVLLKSDVQSATVQGCINPTSTPPPPQTCLIVSSVTAGESSKLTVGKVPVMLNTLVGLTKGLPVPTPPAGNMTVTQVQSKLTAV